MSLFYTNVAITNPLLDYLSIHEFTKFRNTISKNVLHFLKHAKYKIQNEESLHVLCLNVLQSWKLNKTQLKIVQKNVSMFQIRNLNICKKFNSIFLNSFQWNLCKFKNMVYNQNCIATQQCYVSEKFIKTYFLELKNECSTWFKEGAVFFVYNPYNNHVLFLNANKILYCNILVEIHKTLLKATYDLQQLFNLNENNIYMLNIEKTTYIIVPTFSLKGYKFLNIHDLHKYQKLYLIQRRLKILRFKIQEILFWCNSSIIITDLFPSLEMYKNILNWFIKHVYY